MTGKSLRRKSRELALQALFQSEMGDSSAVDGLQVMRDNFEVNRKAYSYALELVEGIVANWSGINDLLQKHAANWRMDRMSLIDRNILRVAIFELWYKKDIPASVVINEAIEVAKRYSSDEAGPFINGILDAVRKKCQGLEE